MEFIKDYMDHAHYRYLLCQMTKSIFDFSFEDWYSAGHHDGEYIPYSFVNKGGIVANAAANITKTMINGDEKLYIQLGTVMTRPQYRKMGLARTLIEKILSDYRGKVDGFYLYANLNALGFYERIGFQRLDQWHYSSALCSEGNKTNNCFKRAGIELLGKYKKALPCAHVNPRMLRILLLKNITVKKSIDSFIWVIV